MFVNVFCQQLQLQVRLSMSLNLLYVCGIIKSNDNNNKQHVDSHSFATIVIMLHSLAKSGSCLDTLAMAAD